ncbi:endonuclease MutS2 [Marinithermofilum abyssi]|uniref:Endonuclease MutS2 n=1 Tax=Marinithermofilum abyssi TaxID=1571185 RepID=A0A8J2YE48_9BACL|nr:endonuclease MutS2 [Marinithermofilum abyssi]GGE17843.1 endonuclease MutS2 [Marinithermofilum abyssi]
METHMLKTLEYPRVIQMLEDQASSDLGKGEVRRLQPADDWIKVKELLDETAEGMDLLRLKGDLSLEELKDIHSALRRSEIGGVLSAGELLDVAATIQAGKKVKRTMESLSEEEAELPLLRGLSSRLHDFSSLRKAIISAIDEEGRVMDEASPELARIRRSIMQIQQNVRAALENILRSPHYQKMLQEGIITQRNDRYVLPVKQEYRSAFGGIVHDQSASGQTVFIEPASVVTQNNRLRELEATEAKEVERILAALTEKVREAADDLRADAEVLTQWDVILAKARFGQVVKGVCPKLNQERFVHLKQARHPLIPAEEAVPIDVELGKDYRAIVITGPNTGGKTVSLKTIGLLALMAQSGMPIPAEEGSSVPVFSGVYADIGDEQSIEQNLSTFSAHMTHIIRILQKIDERSLVLLDELGAGTDPTEGAALAVAILEYLLDQGCRIVATTHYNELKVFAHARPGVINASVEFNEETLQPTYRLLIGVPGRSNAFNIASKLGLPQQIVELAKGQLSTEESRLEEMIGSLASDRRAAEEERRRAEALRKEAEALHRELEGKLEAWDQEKSKMREAARREARTIVSRARREADEVLRQLREWAKERQGSIKEHQLIEAKKRLEDAVPDMELPRKTPKDTAQSARKLQPGDEVLVKTIGQKGQVVEDFGNGEYQVQIGMLKMKARREDLEWKASPAVEKAAATGISSFSRSQSHVKPELDLRGKMVDEALAEIDKYLDDALLAGFHQVSLIHGKGTGALRKGVHRFLDRHQSVKEYRLGGQGEGGSGVTVVSLK